MADTARGDSGRCLDCLPTRQAATAVINRSNKRRNGHPMQTMRCRQCKGWTLVAVTSRKK